MPPTNPQPAKQSEADADYAMAVAKRLIGMMPSTVTLEQTVALIRDVPTPSPSPVQALTFSDLRAANVSRATKWNANGVSIEFQAIELAGEAGEVCNGVKKLARLRMGMKGGSDTTANIAEELADTVICADLLAKSLNIDLGQAVAAKFNATSEKHGFPDRLPLESPVQARQQGGVVDMKAHHVWIRQVEQGREYGGKFYIQAICKKRGIVYLHSDGKWRDSGRDASRYYSSPVECEELLRRTGYPWNMFDDSIDTPPAATGGTECKHHNRYVLDGTCSDCGKMFVPSDPAVSAPLAIADNDGVVHDAAAVRNVRFAFDERSLESIDKLREQGFEFTEVKVGDKTVLLPKIAPPSAQEQPVYTAGRVCSGCGRAEDACACRDELDAPPSAQEQTASTGVDLIAAERQRQITAEGWTPEHDDEHDRGELADAATCYALNPTYRLNNSRLNGVPKFWPHRWESTSWKPTPDNRIRELVKAGALVAAEIDRLQRATRTASTPATDGG